MTHRLVLALVLSACSSPSIEVPPSSPPMTLELTAAPVREAVTTFARASGEPVVIDPSADAFAGCATVSLIIPAPRPSHEVGALLGEALRPSGFELTHGSTGWSLSHHGASPCAPATALAAPTGEPNVEPTGERDEPAATVGPTEASTPATTFEVARADVETWLASPAEHVRLVPHLSGDGADGVTLYGIRAHSLPASAGFQNGDIVRSANGRPLRGPEDALEAYGALRSASEIRVELVRRDEVRVHTVRIVGPPPE